MKNQVDFELIKSRTSLRQIEVLYMVYETKSISEAAAKLNMTTANVSRMCTRFEENCNFAVFISRRKGVRFTEMGMDVISKIAPLANCIGNLGKNEGV
ncbi:hypothetical protein CHX26_08975 [Porphyrobacter sp. HT-58-2]|nr:hypothetical protein CHX26_08975 [Porphyrobacter sp. HT-58-2]